MSVRPHSTAVGPAMVDRVEHRRDRSYFNRLSVPVEYGGDPAQTGVLKSVSGKGASTATRYPQHSLGGQLVHEFFEIGPEIGGIHVILGEHGIDHGVG